MARADKKPGRPSKYTPELAEAILTRLANGETLTDICKTAGVSRFTVSEWIVTKPDFAERHDKARQAQFMVWADEIVIHADTPLIGTVTTVKPSGTETKTWDNVPRSHLKIESRKWLLARLNACVFGDRLKNEHSGPNGGPIPFEKIERVIVDAKKTPPEK